MRTRESIECWIVNEDSQILLLHCPGSSIDSQYWQPVTGGIDLGETSEQACIREVQEETSIKLNSGEISKLDFKMEVYLENHDLLVKKTLFVTKYIPIDSEVVLSHEHDNYKWVSMENVELSLLWDSNVETFKHVSKYLNFHKRY